MTDAERVAYLWREYVYQGLRDLLLSHEATEALREEARAWLFSDAEDKGSFRWACTVAGLNPGEVRDAVLEREGAGC